jgi:hypothetical protein
MYSCWLVMKNPTFLESEMTKGRYVNKLIHTKWWNPCRQLKLTVHIYFILYFVNNSNYTWDHILVVLPLLQKSKHFKLSVWKPDSTFLLRSLHLKNNLKWVLFIFHCQVWWFWRNGWWDKTIRSRRTWTQICIVQETSVLFKWIIWAKVIVGKKKFQEENVETI